MTGLTDKVVLVTGAASGIGRACAEAFAAEGARVMLSDLQDDLGADAVESIAASGAQAAYQHHDVTSEQDWASVLNNLEQRWGALHVLVNNAGIAWAGSILDMTLAQWRQQTAVNLDGVFLGTRGAIPLINASGGGAIINVSSVAGLQGSATLSGYCATKGGVRLFTKGVALECAANGWPIRVNSVHPGIIATPIWESIIPADVAAGANTLEPSELAAGAVPGGTVGSPANIADGVVFLASDQASYMNGAELVIDAGMSA